MDETQFYRPPEHRYVDMLNSMLHSEGITDTERDLCKSMELQPHASQAIVMQWCSSYSVKSGGEEVTYRLLTTCKTPLKGDPCGLLFRGATRAAVNYMWCSMLQ